MTLAHEIINFFDSVSLDRKFFEKNWQLISDYIKPDSKRFDTGSAQIFQGTTTESKSLDGTAERAADDLVSVLSSILVSPKKRFFYLTSNDENLNLEPDIKNHFDEAERKIRKEMFSRKSKFFWTAIQSIDQCIHFGNGPYGIFEDIKTKSVKFIPYSLTGSYIQRDLEGNVTAFYRLIKAKARQIRAEWQDAEGSQMSAERWAQLASDERISPEKTYDVIYACFPRTDRAINSLSNKEKKFASVYVLREWSVVLKESGFDYFPYFVPFWKLQTESDYGIGAAHRAISDILVLNRMVKTNLGAGEVIVTPPMMAPVDSLVNGRLDLSPRALNYISVSPGSMQTNFIKPEPLNVIQNLPVGLEMEDRKREQIKAAFFADLLAEFKNAEMSATETIDRKEARISKLTGPLTFLENDILAPSVEVTYRALIKFGELEQPEALKGKNLEVYFTTGLDEVYKNLQLQLAERAFASAANLQNIPPKVLARIKEERLMDFIFDSLGADRALLRSDKETDQKVADIEEQENLAMQAEVFKQSSEGMKNQAQAAQMQRL